MRKEYKLNYNDDVRDNFIIRNIKIYSDDIDNGNRFNTEFEVDVFSYDYSGKSLFIVDWHELCSFATSLYEMNNNLKGTVCIKDLSLGSNVTFSINKFGRINITGTIFSNHKEQSLKFNLNLDQTYMKRFSHDLYSDLVLEPT
ncbi:MAG: hypothetical protein J1F01_08500 [Oscillospiraceae bacterium]|nr:hypothetical protein [Oscillospiraceae bacterium]